DIPFFTWSVTAGMVRRGLDQSMYETEDPDKALHTIAAMRGDGIFLLRDFARYLEQDRILRRMREIALRFRETRRSLVLSAPVLHVPAELEDEAIAFHLALPDATQLLKVVQAALAEAGEQRIRNGLDHAGTRQLAQNLAGLTLDEARRTLMKCILARRRADASLIAAVLEAKRASLKQEGVLEYLRSEASFADVAGLKGLKQWLRKRRGAFHGGRQAIRAGPAEGCIDHRRARLR
ncbi:MAG: hypothetical protein ACRD5W_07895, partial [Candidatus Acidiferrales bacterium]